MTRRELLATAIAVVATVAAMVSYDELRHARQDLETFRRQAIERGYMTEDGKAWEVGK